MLIGVDWGGTKIEVVALEETEPSWPASGPDTPRVGLRDACHDRRAGARIEQTATAGAARSASGCPASLDPRTGIAKGARLDLAERTAGRVRPAAALGREVAAVERRRLLRRLRGGRRRRGRPRVVFAVILGSGAGAGIAVDGRAHHGPNNSAGEWGHNPLPLPDVTEIPGPACYCGRHGCMETWVSGRVLRRTYRQHAERRPRRPGVDLTARRRSSSACAAGDRLGALSSTATSTGSRAACRSSSTPSTRTSSSWAAACRMSPSSTTSCRPTGGHTILAVFCTPVVPAHHGDSSGVRGAAWLWKD